MAKRKAARASAGGKKKAKKPVRKGSARKTARKVAPRKVAPRKAAPRKVAPRKAAPRKAAPKKAARKAPRVIARKATPQKKASASQKAAPRRGSGQAPRRGSGQAPRRGSGQAVPVRKAPALNRPRRAVVDDDIVQSPPSTLDLDRTASSARSGRRALQHRFNEHTETSPALTAGDVDADWESAYSVGDEAPGGDNPTPDQDIVDDIGKAVGIQYQDNEPLKGAKKVEERDKKRWELDPASAEDWDDR